MFNGAIRVDLKHVQDRFLPPYAIDFPQHKFVYHPYEIFVVNPADVFTVNPALFVWIDMGYQHLQALTTPPRFIKYVAHRIVSVPHCEFSDIKDKYSHFLMISDITRNRNYLSDAMVENEIKFLEQLVLKVKELFKGDPE